MSTKRDLVEAHAFSRRRLVSAFVSGAPGGREVEPVRPGRALIGGIALAVLLLAGAAIAGFFKPTVPDNWDEEGMFLSKETGQGYVRVPGDDALHPIVNATSARLIFADDLNPATVKQEAIDEEEIGDRLGIFGAPESLPGTARLVGTGWTACANTAGGVKLHLDPTVQAAEVPGGATVARAAGQFYVVATGPEGAYRLPLPDAAADRTDVLNALTLGSVTVLETSTDWINLFPRGPELSLASFDLGTPGTVDLGGRSVRVGSLVSLDGVVHLVGADGMIELDEFSQAVYGGLVGFGRPAVVNSFSGSRTVRDPQAWPDAKPAMVDGDEVCAVLHAGEGAAAQVGLAVDAGDSARAGSSLRGRDASVAAGYGAYVLTADHGVADGGTPWVIDSQAKRYRLGGKAGVSAAALGYGSYAVATIPDPWIELLPRCGPELSRAAALGNPDTVEVSTSCPG